MIIITTVKGTLTIIPVVPQINPQNIKDRMLTKGLIFIEFPIHFGSIKFPITTWMDPTTKRIIRAIEKSPNCNKEKTTGNNVANKEPMVGMKFKNLQPRMRHRKIDLVAVPISRVMELI